MTLKAKIFSLLTLTALFVTSFVVPKVFNDKIVPVQLTSIGTTTYSNDIFTSGVVEELSKKDVISKFPIVASKVNYQIGDRVEIDDVLANIDIEATTSALLSLTELKSLIPKEYIDAFSEINVDVDTVASYIPTEITAPAAGIITGISLTAGSVCTPNSAIFTISDQDDVRLKLSVSENDVGRVHNGDTVVFKASATGDKKYVGNVELVFPTASKTLIGTSTATVVNMYVNLPKKSVDLKPGFSVNGVIKSGNKTTVYFLPYECIMQDASNTEFIYIVNGSEFRRCDVKTGMELKEGVEIISPDLNGQRVILNPMDIKSEKEIIKVVKN